VCLNCHATDNLGKPPLKNIGKQLAEKNAEKGKKQEPGARYLHGPLREGRCGGCHDPHGSGNFRLLTGPYPADFYAPYRKGAFDFCLQCHEKYLLDFSQTTLYTKFRNGDRNLHVVHVADKRKGRTCRACHEPHVSDSPKLIAEKGIGFGDWMIPLGFQATATGGRCAPGCHQPFSYDREKPIAYREK
jgi:predicted CXXCH cytochrome family protein